MTEGAISAEGRVEYERFALVLDTGDSVLGRAAMQLIELGIDVLYANDVDEAELLARQESGRLGAVLIPEAFDEADINLLLERVCARLEGGPRGVIVTGNRPDDETCYRLHARGVRWGVWHPYQMRELRFVMAAAMSEEHVGERRKCQRIPTEIPTTVFMGRHRKDVILHDLSVTGAYFATQHPFLEDSRLSIELPLPDGTILAKGVVTNAKTADKPGRDDVPDGMGVAFSDLPEQGLTALQKFVEAWVNRFLL
ncbi:MAG: PilZ domain-containing protein [Deltaproteobacteria bacterium]|nr:PilZ domain-containing protein [Deltaproteobacteria bacterium]